MAEEWLTYAELGGRLALSTEAARQKAMRLRLPRRIGNDGKARVSVDVEDVRSNTPPRKAPEPDEPEAPAGVPPNDPRLLDVMDAHIASLKEIVAREQARADGLQTRLDELLNERANTARRMDDLERAVSDVKTKLQGFDARPAPRPWWTRLAG